MDPIAMTAELGGMGPGYYQGLRMGIAIATLIVAAIGTLAATSGILLQYRIDKLNTSEMAQ